MTHGSYVPTIDHTAKTMVCNYLSEEKTERILVVGCGNSTIGEVMFNAGFQSVTCVDWSPEAIMNMQSEHRKNEGMEYFVADCKCMDMLPNAHYDCVIDKGRACADQTTTQLTTTHRPLCDEGCLDAIQCGYRALEDARLMLEEVYRVLRPGGVFFEITRTLD